MKKRQLELGVFVSVHTESCPAHTSTSLFTRCVCTSDFLAVGKVFVVTQSSSADTVTTLSPQLVIVQHRQFHIRALKTRVFAAQWNM